MGANEILVGEVELRWRDLAGDHPFRPGEEVLVVAVEARAERVDERGLATPAGPSGALRVVRRGWRDVAQVHDIERCDVDAVLHRRRAEEHREICRAEALFAFLAFLGPYLGRVFPRFDALRATRLVAVEIDEELVGASAIGRRTWHADLVVHRDCAI